MVLDAVHVTTTVDMNAMTTGTTTHHTGDYLNLLAVFLLIIIIEKMKSKGILVSCLVFRFTYSED